MSADLHIGQGLPDPLADVESLGGAAAERENELIVHVAESEVLAAGILRPLLRNPAIRAHPSAPLPALTHLEQALTPHLLPINLHRLPIGQVIIGWNGGVEALDALIFAVSLDLDDLVGAALAEVGGLAVVGGEASG